MAAAATQRMLRDLEQRQQQQEQQLEEKQSLSDLFDQLGRDKTQLLDELVLVQSDDIGKLNIDEVLLRYFECKQQMSRVDAWDIDNQALRQMYTASVRLPRQRHFPGCPRPKTSTFLGPRARSGTGHKRGATSFSAKQRLRPDDDKMHRVLQPPDERTEQLAEHLIANSDTYADIQQELARLTDELVNHSLSQAVYNTAVHELSVRLVRTALQRASDNLDARPRTGKQQEEQDKRVQNVANNLAKNHVISTDGE